MYTFNKMASNCPVVIVCFPIHSKMSVALVADIYLSIYIRIPNAILPISQLILESLLEHWAKLNQISVGWCSNYKLVLISHPKALHMEK